MRVSDAVTGLDRPPYRLLLVDRSGAVGNSFDNYSHDHLKAQWVQQRNACVHEHNNRAGAVKAHADDVSRQKATLDHDIAAFNADANGFDADAKRWEASATSWSKQREDIEKRAKEHVSAMFEVHRWKEANLDDRDALDYPAVQ